ncbi:MAG: HEAT repeat domain-containing protein [Candidatus Rifleibacteriota bacterium]
MNNNKAGFEQRLEKAFNHPDSFLETMAKEFDHYDEAKLKTLVGVFAEGGTVEQSLVSEFGVKKLDEPALEFLATQLDENKPEVFIQIAEILGQRNFIKALDRIWKPVKENNSRLIMPVIKAVSKFEQNNLVDKLLLDFYLTHEDESRLFSCIRFLLPRQESIVHKLLESYRGLDADRKMWALKFLAETGNPEALRLFADELDHMPLERGLYCISGLGRIGKQASVKILLKNINHPEWFLRKRIIEALGQTGQVEAVQPVIKMLEDVSVQVRAAAVESLSKLGHLNPEMIIDKLKSSSGDLKINLIRAIAQLKSEKFVAPLIEELNDKNTLFFTVDALGDLGSLEAEKPLKKLLLDKEWFNRLNALEALAKLPLNNKMVEIARGLTNDHNDMVRTSAARIVSSRRSAAEEEEEEVN